MSRRWLRGKCAVQLKIRCRDQHAAEQFAQHVWRVSNRNAIVKGLPPRVVPTFTYRCKSCHYWHITRQASFWDHGVQRFNSPVPMEES